MKYNVKFDNLGFSTPGKIIANVFKNRYDLRIGETRACETGWFRKFIQQGPVCPQQGDNFAALK